MFFRRRLKTRIATLGVLLVGLLLRLLQSAPTTSALTTRTSRIATVRHTRHPRRLRSTMPRPISEDVREPHDREGDQLRWLTCHHR